MSKKHEVFQIIGLFVIGFSAFRGDVAWVAAIGFMLVLDELADWRRQRETERANLAAIVNGAATGQRRGAR